MRFAITALLAAMAASITAAYGRGQTNNNDDDLQKELLHLAHAMKEISIEQSWSSDTIILSENNSFASPDEQDATEWMERKEREVQAYFTLFDGDEIIERSTIMAQSDNDGQFQEIDGVGKRRQLRAVSSSEQQTPATEVKRELGRGVGMKRTDPRAAGRFKRKPPKGRGKESVSSSSSKQQANMEASSEDEAPRPRTQKTAGGRGSYVGRRKSAKSSKQLPPAHPFPNVVHVQPPPPPPEPFPNAVYVHQPPLPPQHQIVEVEECYDIEELEALGIVFRLETIHEEEDEEIHVEEEEGEDDYVGEDDYFMAPEMTRSSPPIYRYDGTLLNRKPGSRRSLQYQYPYTYWTWNTAAKTPKSAKSAKTYMVHGAQPQIVYVGQPPQQPSPPPPPSPLPLIYLKSKSSKSGKSKSSKMGKMTKSGKTCLEPPPTPPLPSICGTDPADAGTNCDSPCTTNEDCTGMMELCIPNVAECAPGFCGSNVDDASKCATLCTSDAQCPFGESCFPGGSVECDSVLGYCGANALDASKCSTVCTSDGDCPGGESCFSYEVVECDSSGGPGYCGSSLLDASKCSEECTSDGDCPSGESCFSETVVTCVGPGYCGENLDDATKCSVECTSNGDCPGGESCFTGGVECQPGHCGVFAEDATKCEVPCSSNAGCPMGESCFTDITCEEETRCPTGCSDCDPDSPLPCPNPMMKQVCDKHNDELYPPGDPKAGGRISNFRDCYDMCKPSFCCIHASLSTEIAPTCAKEYDNCPLYYPCYIIWWKLHDTIGPAPYLRIEQQEPFFNVRLDQLEDDFETDPTFFNQLFGHHFDTDDPLMDDMFKIPENW